MTRDLVSIRVPRLIAQKYERMLAEKLTGQILINFNRGDPQSTELKEHDRITE